MSNSFEFVIQTQRMGHADHYKLTRTAKGWRAAHISYGEEGDKGAGPILYRIFEQDGVSWPHQLPEYLERLWEEAEKGLKDEAVQAALKELADWVTACEQATPNNFSDRYSV